MMRNFPSFGGNWTCAGCEPVEPAMKNTSTSDHARPPGTHSNRDLMGLLHLTVVQLQSGQRITQEGVCQADFGLAHAWNFTSAKPPAPTARPSCATSAARRPALKMQGIWGDCYINE